MKISAEQKLHFLPSFTSCILNIIFQRKSLNVSSLLGAERSYLDYCLQAIIKNWILSLIAVMCSASTNTPRDVNEEIKREKSDMYGQHFSCGKELELMVSIQYSDHSCRILCYREIFSEKSCRRPGKDILLWRGILESVDSQIHSTFPVNRINFIQNI